MDGFVGREAELQQLTKVFERVKTDGRGQCLLLRGRRRIGKSLLVEEFARRRLAPTIFYTATGATAATELTQLAHEVAASTIPAKASYRDADPATWPAALQTLAEIMPAEQPSIVVIDEAPYLMETVPAFEGHLQRTWDRYLSRKPVLLILIGSDLSMMEALDDYRRPFHQRGTPMVLGPLNPGEVGAMIGLSAADAFDATCVTGGLPLVCGDWEAGRSLWEFLLDSLSNPLSALVVSGERALAAEFPDVAHAENVLAAVGSGERTFSNIARASGGIAGAVLSKALATLEQKGLVVGELPISQRPSRERRYRITDPYLRFWQAFVGPHRDLVDRRRGDLVLERVKASWRSWRGRAIEPLIRDALLRILPDNAITAVPGVIGSYWNRSNSVEIDIVGADHGPIARNLQFLGSIKWRDSSPFDRRDLATLVRHGQHLTDAELPLIAVVRTPQQESPIPLYDPDRLIQAWQ